MLKMVYDDMECVLMCIKYSLCYLFNFYFFFGFCEFSYVRRSDFLKDFSFDFVFIYSELDFM